MSLPSVHSGNDRTTATRRTAALLLLVASVAATAIFAAARPQPRPPSAPINWTAVQDDPAQVLDISWMGIVNSDGAIQGTPTQKLIESRFNVRLHPIALDWNAFRVRRPLMLAGGNVPDVLWEGDPSMVRKLVRHGIVLELPYDVLLRHAPTYVAQLNRYGPEAWLYARADGANWGVPTFQAGNRRPRAGVWRADWLAKVGIASVPTNLDEMHEALRRITFNDPDGNGVNDTYGMSPFLDWSRNFAEVFAAYGVLPGDLVVRDGTIVWGGTLPEARVALATLRQWYAEGLIDPDYVVAGRSMDAPLKKFLGGRTGYVYDASEYRMLNPADGASLQRQIRTLYPKASIVPSAPLLGPTGTPTGRAWGGPAHVVCFGSHLADQPQKVLRMLRILETLAQDSDLAITANCGTRGTHWDYTPERGLFRLAKFDTRDSRRKLLLGEPVGGGFFSPGGVAPEVYQQFTGEKEKDFDDHYRRPAWTLVNALGKTDVLDSASEHLESLRDLQATWYTQIIRGQRPLESFDEFVAQWNARGGAQLLAEANRWIETRDAIFDRVGVRIDRTVSMP